MSTKRILAEQVLYRLYGGYNDKTDAVQIPDVVKAIEQKINQKFRTQQLTVNLPSGETIPSNLHLATYTSVTVTSDGSRSKATLPAIPINLPRNMGVYDVYDSSDNHYIPLQRGQRNLLRTDDLLNDLLGQIGYEVNGKTVYFTKDLTLLGITSVNMDLVVMDLSIYGDNDTLPLPSDLEDEIVNELVVQFAPSQPESGVVTNFSEPPKNI